MIDINKIIRQKGICSIGNSVKTDFFLSEGQGLKLEIRNFVEYEKIESLSDYFRILKEIHGTDSDNKVLYLYRGQNNVNYTFVPTIMRSNSDLEREKLLFQEFRKRFYDVLKDCENTFEQEMYMQHYGIGSRCLDLMENPLIALWAACSDENGADDTFGEVSLWAINKDDSEYKYYDSSTVSVISNIAKMDKVFSMGHLQMEYSKEMNTKLEDFIYIKDILRRSVIVSPKYLHTRIRNQQGSLALCSLCKLVDNGFSKKFHISIDDFSEYILNAEKINKDKDEEYKRPNIDRLRAGYHTLRGINFSNLSAWDLWFEKITPNESPYIDYFDLYKYMLNFSNNPNQRKFKYIIIPPQFKKDILEELKYLNITKAFIYPEMSNISEELKNNYLIKNS